MFTYLLFNFLAIVNIVPLQQVINKNSNLQFKFLLFGLLVKIHRM